jgi:hypothetical protein
MQGILMLFTASFCCNINNKRNYLLTKTRLRKHKALFTSNSLTAYKKQSHHKQTGASPARIIFIAGLKRGF